MLGVMGIRPGEGGNGGMPVGQDRELKLASVGASASLLDELDLHDALGEEEEEEEADEEEGPVQHQHRRELRAGVTD
eukprot:845420-Rhodomonas_salina.1